MSVVVYSLHSRAINFTQHFKDILHHTWKNYTFNSKAIIYDTESKARYNYKISQCKQRKRKEEKCRASLQVFASFSLR